MSRIPSELRELYEWWAQRENIDPSTLDDESTVARWNSYVDGLIEKTVREIDEALSLDNWLRHEPPPVAADDSQSGE